MDKIRCPSCGAQVLPMIDQRCPNCAVIMTADADEPRPRPPDGGPMQSAGPGKVFTIVFGSMTVAAAALLIAISRVLLIEQVARNTTMSNAVAIAILFLAAVLSLSVVFLIIGLVLSYQERTGQRPQNVITRSNSDDSTDTPATGNG